MNFLAAQLQTFPFTRKQRRNRTMDCRRTAQAPPTKVALIANSDWYLYNFRISLAEQLRKEGCEVVLLSPEGEYGQLLRAKGFRWFPIPMERRSLNPLRELNLLVWLTGFFMRERPLLVHGFTIKCAVYGSLAARAAGVPARVNSVAGMGYVFTSDDLLARALRPLVRALLQVALHGSSTRVILQNRDDAELFRTAGLIAPESIRVIRGSGVDCSKFQARSGAGVSARPLRALLAARLLWDKGIAEFVDAARQLRHAGRTIDCLVAGAADPGNPASIPQELLDRWQSEGVVQWLGHVRDMPALLSSVDVMVLPSYREGLPRALIEAGACALALVTTDAPGCREVVADGVDGLRVPVRDSRALARALIRLDEDREFATRLGRAARAKVIAQFDERIVLEQTLAIYRELIPTSTCVSADNVINQGRGSSLPYRTA